MTDATEIKEQKREKKSDRRNTEKTDERKKEKTRKTQGAQQRRNAAGNREGTRTTARHKLTKHTTARHQERHTAKCRLIPALRLDSTAGAQTQRLILDRQAVKMKSKYFRHLSKASPCQAAESAQSSIAEYQTDTRNNYWVHSQGLLRISNRRQWPIHVLWRLVFACARLCWQQDKSEVKAP